MSTSHSPLSAFFSAYAGFQYNPSRSPEAEFQRLRRHLEQRNEHWKIEGALSDYKNAVTKQFNAIYGTDVNDIESWHRLCAALRIYPIPEGLEACREIVRATHVNIVDLVHSEGRSAVTIFSSEKKLSEYTIEKRSISQGITRTRAASSGTCCGKLRTQVVGPILVREEGEAAAGSLMPKLGTEYGR